MSEIKFRLWDKQAKLMVGIKKNDWCLEDGTPAIVNGVALMDLDKDTKLISYGKFVTEKDLEENGE